MTKSIEEEFEELIAHYEKGELQDIDVQEAMKLTMEFFTKLKERLATASPEEQQMLIEKVNAMYKRIADVTSSIAETTGMNEEQLLAYADNPDNFTEDQWAMIQRSKTMVENYSEDISQSIGSEDLKKESEKRHARTARRPGGRSKWMKT